MPDDVPPGLRVAAAYSWRLLVVGALGYVILSLLARLEFVVIALFFALVITALVGPLVKVFQRAMPRGLAVALGLLLSLFAVGGVLTFIGSQVAGQIPTLADEFRNGLQQIYDWLQNGPLKWDADRIEELINEGRQWITDNQSAFAQNLIGSAGTFAEAITGAFLALFAAIFFLSGGDRIWKWLLSLTPRRQRPRVDGAGHVAWNTLSGYTRGIVVVAASNALFVAIGLSLLRVPLAIPLSLLVFFGSFIPIIGAPIAMLIAAVVALASQGPFVALGVVVMIALIGQFEGHVMQPLVMARAVSIHPLAVALSVAAGTVLAGIVGAIIAVPVVSVVYAVSRFWVQTTPRIKPREREALPADPTGTGAM
jgi:putative heme transporter